MASMFRFVGDSLLDGISLLVVVTPASLDRMQTQVPKPDFARHFVQVGHYIRCGMAAECDQLKRGNADELEPGPPT